MPLRPFRRVSDGLPSRGCRVDVGKLRGVLWRLRYHPRELAEPQVPYAQRRTPSPRLDRDHRLVGIDHEINVVGETGFVHELAAHELVEDVLDLLGLATVVDADAA